MSDAAFAAIHGDRHSGPLSLWISVRAAVQSDAGSQRNVLDCAPFARKISMGIISSRAHCESAVLL